MSRTPYFPPSSYGHGPIVPPPGLDVAREKRKEQMMKCGQCRQNFSAICALHQHLNGDSYHYDKELRMAYPLEEGSCPGFNEDENSVTGTYLTESGVRVINMKKKTCNVGKVKKEPSTAKPDKIISIQVYPDDDDDDDDNIEADPANVDLEYFGPAGEVQKVHSQLQTETRSHVTMVNLHDVGGQEIPKMSNSDFEAIGENELEEITESQMAAEIKKEIQSDIEGQDDYETNYEHSDRHVHIENDGQLITDNVSTDEHVNISGSVPNLGGVLHVPENPVLVDTATTNLQEAGDGLYYQQQNQNEVQTSDTDPSEFVMTKQMIIDLHSLETNEDGSLKIVVGEKDAGIFRTPQGEEILKALKAQGKGLSVKNTQIVYNYSVPITLEGTTRDELAETNIHIPAISDSPLKSVKRDMRKAGMDDLDEQAKKRKYARQDDMGEVMAENVDGLEAVVFMRQEEQITTKEAMDILGEVKLGMHEDKISKIQPLKANGGDLYVIDLESLPNRKDIRHDKYIWFNVGTRRYPKKKELLKKTVFKIRLPDQTFSDAFMKSIYEWIDEKERYCIIHYTGHEEIFKPFPHGNCKSGKNFTRTCRSVIEGLKQMATDPEMSPTDVFKQVKGVTVPGMRNLRAPRNLDQIKNHFFYEKKKKLAAIRKASQGKNEVVISSNSLSSTDDIEMTPTDAVTLNVLSPSLQPVNPSQPSHGSPAVSLLPPLLKVSSGQPQLIQVSSPKAEQSRILQITDTNNQPQIIAMSNVQPQVIQVSDDQGQIIQVTDEHGQIIHVTNERGEEIQVDDHSQVFQVSQGQQIVQLPDGRSQVIQVSDSQLEGAEQGYAFVTISH